MLGCNGLYTEINEHWQDEVSTETKECPLMKECLWHSFYESGISESANEVPYNPTLNECRIYLHKSTKVNIK